jgi:hypothetical protein
MQIFDNTVNRQNILRIIDENREPEILLTRLPKSALINRHYFPLLYTVMTNYNLCLHLFETNLELYQDQRSNLPIAHSIAKLGNLPNFLKYDQKGGNRDYTVLCLDLNKDCLWVIGIKDQIKNAYQSHVILLVFFRMFL